MTRLIAWWKAYQLRALHDYVRNAAATYMSAKTRYENALIEAAMPKDEGEKK